MFIKNENSLTDSINKMKYLQDKPSRGSGYLRNRHWQENVLFDRGLYSYDGGLDKGTAERAEAKRNEALAEQRRQ